MQVNRVIFYGHHFTIRVLNEQCKRKLIVMEDTVLVHLPATYSLRNQSYRPEVCSQVAFISSIIRDLHECIDDAFDPITHHYVTGVPVPTK